MTNKLKLLGLVAAQLVLMFSSDAEAGIQISECLKRRNGKVINLVKNTGPCTTLKVGATCGGFNHGDCIGSGVRQCNTNNPQCCCWND